MSKTRGLPSLPTDDLVLHGDQIDSVHLEKQHNGYWWLGVCLADGRRITVTFAAPAVQVLQTLEDRP